MRPHPSMIALAIAVFASTGCTSSRSSGLQFIESAKSRLASLDARRGFRAASRSAANDERASQIEDRYKTVPEVEANLDMRLRQRFEMGEPELDVEKAREVLDLAIFGHSARLAQYESDLAQWEAHREHFISTNPNDTFSTRRPTKPELAVMANEIPMKISLRIGTKIDNASVTGFRTRQIPATNE